MFHVEQNLTNEIIASLMQADIHPRGIAEKLHSNHTTIARKLHILVDENIVDYRTEGKNNIYFLKKSIEARNAVMITEIYKQSRIVSTYPILRGIFQAILEMPEIQLALLYGSYAKELAIKGSDIDLYIETLNPSVKKHLEQRHSLLSVKIGEFDTNNLLIREIIKEHIIVKGVEAYMEKTGFLTNSSQIQKK
jgi:predicted nucleotidyltransferase